KMSNQYLENNYKIKLIKSSSDIDYIDSVKIYSRVTPSDIRTNTNELTYWLDNKTVEFESYFFSLFLNDTNIGLAMCTYLRSTKTVVIEYIAVEDAYRKNNTYLSYLNELRMFISNLLEVTYFICEISNKNNGVEVDDESKIFKTILSIENFFTIDADYHTPPLGINNEFSSFEAKLMINSNTNIKTIPKETYIRIVQSLYFEYYVNWYTPFFSESERLRYNNQIQNTFASIQNKLEELPEPLQFIEVNKDKLKSAGSVEKLPAPKKKLNHNLTSMFISIFAFPIIIIVYYKVFNFFGIDTTTNFTPIIGGISSIIVGILPFLLKKDTV
ncbi:TPA: hypothetical protein ACGYZW_001729, partial [Streptococcus pyogenes]